MTEYIEINNPGILSTIQDGGRYGFQGSGFQPSGCMDMRAYHDANVLVNNPVDAPVIEMLYMGITATFWTHTYIAITGAVAEIVLNGRQIKEYATYEINRGDKLEIKPASLGRFIYLAIAGGINIPKVMGSFSTNLKCKIGGFEGRPLRAGDKLPVNEYTGFFPNLYLKEMLIPFKKKDDETLLHIIWGPQDYVFTQAGKDTFTTEYYSITDESDRMGYRLDGPVVEYKDSVDILSDGIVFGSIQIPANGKPMILMADRQTTGGYAKIATVISADLHKLSQCMPGEKVRFCAVTLEEAKRINKIEEKNKRKFRRKSGYTGR